MKLLSFVGLFLSAALYAGTYSVPVSGDLYSESVWNNVVAHAEIIGDKLSIYYELPTDLVGTQLEPLIAVGTVTAGTSFVQVKGKNVFGNCMLVTDRPVTCLLKYPKSIVDETSRDQSLSQHFQGEQLVKRTRIARIFGADPAGLLSIELK